jgi:serine/threonine protein kinase
MNATPAGIPEGRRRYRVLDLIGRGGFGSVYRARLEGLDGFTKEVALKIVRNADVSLNEIARFRDEARILGLVRDRAVVGVDPPIRLDGRWAIVMEYVEGVSAQRLVQQGPVPPRAALEIVQEIARALHKVYAQPGPEGRPLHLVHRDLKPANVQITPDGDVKLLDFGVASARFASRETVTSNTIGGTIGYIAPERLRGHEGPEADIFSLGVLLHVLVTADRATDLDVRNREPQGRPPEIERVLAFAERMRNPDPSLRPPARTVEQDCAVLGASMPGPTLRQYAQATVPADGSFQPDELVGSMLTETVELRPERSTEGTLSTREPVRRGWLTALVLASIVSVLTATVAVGASIAAVAFTWNRTPLETPAPIDVPVEDDPLPAPPVVPDPVVEVAPVVPPPVVPEPVRGDREPPRRREPAPVEAAPTAPTAPEPAAPEPLDLVEVTFDSVPPGATISLNGMSIGRTPLRGHPVSVGTYELRLEHDGRSIVREVRLGGRRGNTSFTWNGDQLVVR